MDYYKCNHCHIVFKVVTESYLKIVSKSYVKIPTCPHCKSKNIKLISFERYINTKFNLYHRLFRTYRKQKIGSKRIELGIKFPC